MKMRSINKICASFLSTALLVTSSMMPIMGASAAGNFDYSTALKDAIVFYDANKCGKDVKVNNVFDWRDACHTSDGSDVGVDLTGGYHDAGDHVKFGLPQGYAASVLGWSLYEFKEVFDSTGNTTKTLQQLKYFTDYFLKSHPDANTFYYQVGDGDIDHQYWGNPSLQTGSRPAKCVANASKPASDVLGDTAAALALMYLNYKNIDSAYANKCLQAAKELYVMGKSNKGIGDGQYFYASSGYADEMAWGAVWLYFVSNDEQYLTDAKQFVLEKNMYGDNPLQNKWTMCWDSMYIPTLVKLTELTGDATYKGGVEYSLNYWMNTLETTPGGMKYLHYWGPLRYAAAESMLALVYYKQNSDVKYIDLAQSQIDYILGKNPAGISYEMGFGTKWPTYPHHRAAQGYEGYNDNANTLPAKHLLLGALIGGPDKADVFKDSAIEYQYSEVALDYNAGFVGALAGLLKYRGNIVIPSSTPNIPTPTPTATPVVTPTKTPVVEPTVTSSPVDGMEFTVDTTFSAARLVSNQMITAKVTATNVSSMSYSGVQNVLLVVGLYDSNNTMVNVSYISKGIPYHGTENLSAGFKLPADVTGYTVRAFMWDGTDMKDTNMIPYSNVTHLP